MPAPEPRPSVTAGRLAPTLRRTPLARDLRRAAPAIAALLAITTSAAAEPPRGAEVVHRPVAPRVVTRAAPLPGATAGDEGTTYRRLEAFANMGTAWNPPDPNVAVGPHGVLQVVNSDMTYYRRDGMVVWTVSFEPFTQGGKVWVDPKVLFDPESGRFIVAALRHACATSHLLLLVSAVSDPGGSPAPDPADWHLYEHEITQMVGGTPYGGDYTGLGFDGQAIYVTFNMSRLPFRSYPGCAPPSGSFHHVSIFVVDKADAVQGTFTVHRVDAPAGAGPTFQPASVAGATAPANVAYFAESSTASNAVSVWALSDPLGARTLSQAAIAVPSHGGPATCAPQPAGAGDLDAFTTYAQSAWWHGGTLWFCHTALGPGFQSMAYWYAIATHGFPAAPPALEESGAFGGVPGVWSFQPALGVNASGDVCAVWSESGPALAPRVVAALRPATAAGFTAPFLVEASTHPFQTSYGPGPALCGWAERWGDYGGVAADPEDGTFWVSHELARPPGYIAPWGTTVANVFVAPAEGWIAGGTALRTGVEAVGGLRAIADGQGGVFAAWNDDRVFTRPVHVVRLGGDGVRPPGWAFGGNLLMRVETWGNDFSFGPIALAPDDSGGVYVVRDAPAGGVRRGAAIQRLDAFGAIVAGWPDYGLVIDLLANPVRVAAITDGRGGVIVAARAGDRVRAARVDRERTTPWGSSGVDLGGGSAAVAVVSDGDGGAIVVWESDSLRAQRVDRDGATRWRPGGVALAVAGSDVVAAPDGFGGVVVASRRRDSPGSPARDVWAVRAGGSGEVAPGWEHGVAVAVAAGNQIEPQIVADGTGGAIVAWTDLATPGGRVRALRLSSAGAVVAGWAGDLPVTSDAAIGAQSAPTIAADGAGGALIAWQDARGIHLQHLDAPGTRDPGYPADGLALSGDASFGQRPHVLVTGPGVAIVAWEDERGQGSHGIYAGRAEFALSVAAAPPPGASRSRLALASPRPSPARDGVRIGFDLPGATTPVPFTIGAYDVTGRRVATLARGSAAPGSHEIHWDLRDDAGRRVRPGVYHVLLRSGTERSRRALVVTH